MKTRGRIHMNNELRPGWRKIFNFDWKFGLFLILIICVPRFMLVLNANETANYSYIGLIMTVSAIAPFVFLSKYGRKETGLTRPGNYYWLLPAFISGLIFSVLLHFTGDVLYQDSFENWYVYIGKSYNIPAGINPDDKQIMFIIMAVTGMLFSPVGEELFFRGIVHSAFARSVGNSKASVIDSAAFALTHISHFGLVFISGEWKFFLWPAVIWGISMFLVSILFYICRKKSGSLLGAVISHSGFNLGMIYCIFYL